jgi:hypothetical protein
MEVLHGFDDESGDGEHVGVEALVSRPLALRKIGIDLF